MVKEVEISILKTEFNLNGSNLFMEEFTDFLLEIGVMSLSISTQSKKKVFNKTTNQFEKKLDIILQVPDSLDESVFMLKLLSKYDVTFNSFFKKLPSIDWVLLSQSKFKPINILNKIWIAASWHKIPPKDSQSKLLKISIDPGQAFGTGDHPTTKLCIESLIHISGKNRNCHVLDLGCGSGILSIVASKLGFHFVTGIDNDKIAVDAAKKNAALNGIKNSAFFLTKNLEELDETFDLVVSNILFSTLNDLSSLILKKLKKNGSLIFSGILRSQVSDLTKTYLDMSQNKIYLKKISSQGDWVCLAHYGVSHQENKYKY